MFLARKGGEAEEGSCGPPSSEELGEEWKERSQEEKREVGLQGRRTTTVHAHRNWKEMVGEAGCAGWTPLLSRNAPRNLREPPRYQPPKTRRMAAANQRAGLASDKKGRGQTPLVFLVRTSVTNFMAPKIGEPEGDKKVLKASEPLGHNVT